MTYQLAEVGVIRLEDGLHITRDMPEWEDYRAWIHEGNEPEPIPEVAPAPLTPEEITARLTYEVQRYLDETARSRGYDGILSACTYATSSVPKFAAEGQACVTWRDSVWATCYVLMGDVMQGLIAIPTAAELIAALPQMVWPEV